VPDIDKRVQATDSGTTHCLQPKTMCCWLHGGYMGSKEKELATNSIAVNP